MTRERAIVLGATGFIGRHLVRRLAAAGTAVTCPVVASRGGAERAPDEPGVAVVVLDDLDTPGLERCLAGEPAAVFNLAASGVDPAHRDPVSLLDGNAGIVARLLAAARTFPPRVVVHAGSWSEYADPVEGEKLDEESPLRPRSVYGAAKVAAELYGATLSARFGVPFVTLRLFNVYGEGEAPHRLLPHLVARLSRGEPADLTNGTQARDFVHVSDAVDAMVHAAASTRITAHDAFNVCTGSGTTVREFALGVADALGASPDLLRFGVLPQRADEPPAIIGDPGRLARTTGWEATLTVREGIARSLAALHGAGDER